MTSVAGFSIDDISEIGPIGSISTAIINNLYGIDHRQMPNLVPANKEHYGMVFFTRPQLNMQTENLRNVRRFTNLLTKDTLSLHTYVRCILDPRLQYGYPGGDPAVNCPIVDNYQAFIPLLTSQAVSISGWPDLVIPTSNIKEGNYKEGFTMVDGTSENYTAYDIEALFRNRKGAPIMRLFDVWERYATLTYEGNLMPYIDMITEYEMDYWTRIYRITFQEDKKHVAQIATTIAVPTTLPYGSQFDMNIEKPFTEANADIAVRFKCIGFETNDPILIHEFNQCVSIFNPAMRDDLRDAVMQKVPDSLKIIFNNRGYFRINPQTMEFEIWVSKDLFLNKIEALKQIDLLKLLG